MATVLPAKSPLMVAAVALGAQTRKATPPAATVAPSAALEPASGGVGGGGALVVEGGGSDGRLLVAHAASTRNRATRERMAPMIFPTGFSCLPSRAGAWWQEAGKKEHSESRLCQFADRLDGAGGNEVRRGEAFVYDGE